MDLQLLPSVERKSFLNQFEMFLVTDNEWNWRFREELAQQLLRIIPLYSPEETCTHLVPVAIALLRDKVAAVRTSALSLVKFYLLASYPWRSYPSLYHLLILTILCHTGHRFDQPCHK